LDVVVADRKRASPPANWARTAVAYKAATSKSSNDEHASRRFIFFVGISSCLPK
jgi:hypothetical protein